MSEIFVFIRYNFAKCPELDCNVRNYCFYPV